MFFLSFQSTHSRGVRPPYETISRKPQMFQSTHSRGVRLYRGKVIEDNCCFNPRTHEECDAVLDRINYILDKFQSTHSRGVRLRKTKQYGKQKNVSIHALTRSATFFHFFFESVSCFNPRTHEECDF